MIGQKGLIEGKAIEQVSTFAFSCYPRWDSRMGGVFSGVSVRLCFNTMSQKPLQLGSPNVTQKCTTMSLGNPFILGSEDQRSRSKGTKTLLEWVLTLFWQLVSS